MVKRLSTEALIELGIRSGSKKAIVFAYFNAGWRPQDVIHRAPVGKKLTRNTIYRYHKEWSDKLQLVANLTERGLL
jgi:hypothetical protein